jgi:hypothetical protein
MGLAFPAKKIARLQVGFFRVVLTGHLSNLSEPLREILAAD